MTKSTFHKTSRSNNSAKAKKLGGKCKRKTQRSNQENSDVLISAVISSYLLTHLHQVLQRSEYVALQEGRNSQAANFAQLRKVLCMDARSMKDAFALGMQDSDIDKFHDSNFQSKAA